MNGFDSYKDVYEAIVDSSILNNDDTDFPNHIINIIKFFITKLIHFQHLVR